LDLNTFLKDCVFKDIDVFIGHLIEISKNLRNNEIKIPSVLKLDLEYKQAINRTLIPHYHQFYMTYDGRNEKLAKETRGDMKWETKIF
jgi:hypothetical protein